MFESARGSKKPERCTVLKSYDKKDNIIFTEKSGIIAITGSIVTWI